MDVGVGKFRPERFPSVTEIQVDKRLAGARTTFDVLSDDTKSFVRVSGFGMEWFAVAVVSDVAARTPALVTAGDHALLGEVCHVYGEDREDLAYESVGADHVDAVGPGLDQ